MPRFTPRVLLATAVMSLVATWHAGTAHAAPRHWRPEDYPNPSTDITRCSREAAGSLCDPDRLITTEAMADIDALLLKLKTGAKPFAQMDCGAAGLVGFPVGVALMHRMCESPDSTAAAHSFAAYLQDHWEVGLPACDNGAVLLVSELGGATGGVAALSAGRGVTQLLSAEKLQGIEQGMVEMVGQKRFAAAVEWGINTLGKALADALPPHGGGDSGGGGGSGGGGSGAGGSSSGDDSGGGGASGADGGRHSGDVPHWLTLFGESAIVAMSAAVLALGTTLYTRIKFQKCKVKLFSLKRDAAARAAARASVPTAAATTSPWAAASGVVSALCTCLACGTRLGAGFAQQQQQQQQQWEQPQQGRAGRYVPPAPTPDDIGSLAQPLLPAAGSQGQQQAGGDGATTPMLLPCGHAFCEGCLLPNLQHSAACPSCGAGVSNDTTSTASATGATGGSSLPPGALACDIEQPASTASTPLLASEVVPVNSYSPSSSAPAAIATTTLSPVLLWQLRRRWVDAHAAQQQQEQQQVLLPTAHELVVRLQQLHTDYPEFVKEEMVVVWERDLNAGRELDAQQLRAFEAAGPQGHGVVVEGVTNLVATVRQAVRCRPQPRRL